MEFSQKGDRPFTLVLGGGGARGFVHVGVLRGLEIMGYRPDAIVGVSMGAVVGVTYSLRTDWYKVLSSLDTRGISAPPQRSTAREAPSDKFRSLLLKARTLWDLSFRWGPGEQSLEAGMAILEYLFESQNLSEGRVPVAVCATDLMSGDRVVITSGPAVQATYASSALAGVLPPLRRGKECLADGAYSDIAPIDVAHQIGGGAVIAVDPGQPPRPRTINTGLQAIIRAAEICYTRHAHLRFEQADLCLRPNFPRQIDTLDFTARRVCIAAGIRIVREQRELLQDLLGERPKDGLPIPSW